MGTSFLPRGCIVCATWAGQGNGRAWPGHGMALSPTHSPTPPTHHPHTHPPTPAPAPAGTGIEWLWPLVDGHPPSGWDTALRYLVLPVAVVVAQYISTALVSPPADPNSDNAKTTQALLG